METPSSESTSETSTASESTEAAEDPLAKVPAADGAAIGNSSAPKGSIKKPEPVTPENYLDALTDRIQYANVLLSYFETLRMHALGAKVPKPYQKRWQYDSNLFFKMAFRAKERYEKGMNSKKKGKY